MFISKIVNPFEDIKKMQVSATSVCGGINFVHVKQDFEKEGTREVLLLSHTFCLHRCSCLKCDQLACGTTEREKYLESQMIQGQVDLSVPQESHLMVIIQEKGRESTFYLPFMQRYLLSC